MLRRAVAIVALWAVPSAAADVVATRPLERGAILSEADLEGNAGEISALVGHVVRRPLAEGRRVRPFDVERAVDVVRQQTVSVLFRRGALTLRTEGRAMQKGAVGERISISLERRRQPISAMIVAPGVVEVGR